MMNQAIAETINATFRRVGVAFRWEFVTPRQAQTELEQNPALLAKYEISQKMAGDLSDDTLDAAKGRPFANVLAGRIAKGEWRPHMGIVSRLENGGIVDGVTRFIAIANTKKIDPTFEGVWVQTFNAADPKAFYMYDDPESARGARDVIRNANFDHRLANIIAVMAPKAAGGVDLKTCDWVRVNRDAWWPYVLKHKESLVEAAEFVQAKTRRGKAVPRKNLTALVYHTHVSQKGLRGTRKAAEAKRLLTAYVRQMTTEASPWDEMLMVDLSAYMRDHQRIMHERKEAMPLFFGVVNAILRGEKGIRLIDPKTTGGVTGFTYKGKPTTPKKKAAAAGR